jgi:hypothetical protein
MIHIRTSLPAAVLAVVLTGVTTAAAQSTYPPAYDALTGTYQLDRTRGEDATRIMNQAVRQLPQAERASASARLRERLEPPDVLAIERRGNAISLASSRVPEMTFQADGETRVERGLDGHRLTTTASLYGDRLELSARDSGGNDFSVTFEPLDSGDGLRVTRRLFDDQLRQPLVMESIYRKTSPAPDWDVYTGAMPGRYDSNAGTARSATTLVPAGTALSATLDQPIDFRQARANDRITLTVRRAPDPRFEDARIEGVLLNTPTPTSGRTGVTMEFDWIRLADGQSGPFEGFVESVRGPDGDPVDYDGERIEPAEDRTEQAIQRGAVGAALGALIGAIAGGGEGAAIGAVLGGGGAAATVYVDELNQRTLPRGTEFTIRASASDRR